MSRSSTVAGGCDHSLPTAAFVDYSFLFWVIDFRIQLRPNVPVKLLEMLKDFLHYERFSHPVTLAAEQRPRYHRSMHHPLTRRPTVRDSAPISVRLMRLIYQSEGWVVSAVAEDKTSPSPEIILLPLARVSASASLVFHDGVVDGAGVNSGFCSG